MKPIDMMLEELEELEVMFESYKRMHNLKQIIMEKEQEMEAEGEDDSEKQQELQELRQEVAEVSQIFEETRQKIIAKNKSNQTSEKED